MFNEHYLSQAVTFNDLPEDDNIVIELKNLIAQFQLSERLTPYTMVSVGESTITGEEMEKAELCYGKTPPVYKNGWHKVPQEIVDSEEIDEYINEKYKFHVSIRWNKNFAGKHTTIRNITIW